MADTLANFLVYNGQRMSATIDPFDFRAVIAPYTAQPDVNAPPVVASFVPPPSAIGRQQILQFDVTDDRAVTALVVSVRFEAVPPSTKRPKDVVFDSDGFADFYAGSTVQAITGGYRFRILRVGGWPSPPRVYVVASDGLVAS